MKMFKSLFVGLALLSFVVTGCDKDGNKDVDTNQQCLNAWSDAGNAALAFANSPSLSTCNAYKSALQSAINKCTSGEIKDQAQEALDGLDCSVFE